jgi:3' terminal RNA ribose 2'-O-methyltransferase Hen1
VLLTLTTTHEPATDLGYLLVKHPDRVHTIELPAGTAYVCFPEASTTRCTAALLLEVDPARLRGATRADFTLSQHVNDRPYAASSLLAGALNRAFRSALRGECADRPELASTPIPLEIRIPVVRGGAHAERLFAPLGWTVELAPVPLDETRPHWGPSRYVSLTLTGTLRLADALNHLYVLLPVLDDAKHYWVAPDEVDKLLRAGEGWLAAHPSKAFITGRFLAHQRRLTDDALEQMTVRLAEADDGAEPDSVDAVAESAADEEADLTALVPPALVPLARQRRDAVLAALASRGPARVLDLGCGEGALLADLIKVPAYTELVGVDVSPRALAVAERRLRLDRLPARQRERIRLLQSALTYTDDRLVGFDAAVLMEVVEHIDPPRLPTVAASVFGHAKPSTVVVTTPNVEYNSQYAGLPEGKLRHHDHRFEWTRAEFADWCSGVAEMYGYTVDIHGVGSPDATAGAPTQLALFARTEQP